MPRGINDGDVVLAGLEFPERNVNGDTTLTLGLQFVQHPGVLEGALAHLDAEKKQFRSIFEKFVRPNGQNNNINKR